VRGRGGAHMCVFLGGGGGQSLPALAEEKECREGQGGIGQRGQGRMGHVTGSHAETGCVASSHSTTAETS
jgi:hypothetical protein